MASIDGDGALSATLAACWALLELAARDPRLSTHRPVLSTGADRLGLRTVVLRETDPLRRCIRCHTDRRSTKVSELARSNHAEWLFYESSERIQIRVGGPSSVHATDKLADRLWNVTPPHTRTMYRSPHVPGRVIDAAMAHQDTDGRENFAVIETQIAHLDYLRLDDNKHHRAKFFWTDDHVEAYWVAP